VANLNRVLLIGRLTRAPELRYTPSGQPVTSFSLATNRYAGGEDGERREVADFHNVVVWNQGQRRLAEIVADHLVKGQLVYIEGRLQTRSWEGQDGQRRRTTEVVASEVQFLARPARSAEEQPLPDEEPTAAAQEVDPINQPEFSGEGEVR
jgi:single-strand DNA-binding protein